MGALSSQNVLIFGAGRGIGRVVAQTFGQQSNSLTIVARSKDELEETAKSIKQATVLSQIADISNFESVRQVVSKHLDKFKTVDIAVNTAASQGPIGPLWENNPEEWLKTVNINLTGSFNICRTLVPEMIKQGKGTIILFSGGGAAYARPNFSAYGASKTGVLRLAETLACELEGSEVVVYAVAPGAVNTNMTREVVACEHTAGPSAFNEAQEVLNTGGTSPQKAADLCLFLAKERPANLSGRLIHVNEPYVNYCSFNKNSFRGDCGLLRRIDFIDNS